MSRFKVICIDDDFSNLGECKEYGVKLPKFWHTYTVRHHDKEFNGYLFYEIWNEKFFFTKHGNILREPQFATRRFVPLETDEVETEFLNPLEMIV